MMRLAGTMALLRGETYSGIRIGNNLSNRISVVWHVIGVKPLLAPLEHVLGDYLRLSNFIPPQISQVLIDDFLQPWPSIGSI